MPAYYGDVDADYLDRVGELKQPIKQRTYELMQIGIGSKVMDVGCGPGIDTVALARLVGPSGQVVGIDFNPAFLTQAGARAEHAGVQSWVTYRQADATNLPFADGTFDACRSERLMQHLPHAEAAVAEMVRVLRPRGWLVIQDSDWGTFSIDTAESEVALERRLVQWSNDQRRNAYAGRQLYRFFKRQQLTDIVIELRPIYFTDLALAEQVFDPLQKAQTALEYGAFTADEVRRWHASLAQADADGVFFASYTGILIAGRKP